MRSILRGAVFSVLGVSTGETDASSRRLGSLQRLALDRKPFWASIERGIVLNWLRR